MDTKQIYLGYSYKSDDPPMTLFCPVTSLKILTYPEWINQKVSDTLIVSNWIIGNAILYSLVKGRVDLKGAKNAIALHDEVAKYVSGGNDPYVQIDDFAFVSGASLSARRHFTGVLNRDKRRQSIIFCNLSLQTSIAVNFGSRLNTSGKDIHVAKNYKNAIRHAITIADQKHLDQSAAPVDLGSFSTSDNKILEPIDVLSDDNWKIHTPEFSNTSIVIDQCIMHSVTKGYVEPQHIPLTDRLRAMCQSALPGNSRIKYIVVDARKVKGGSRRGRFEYMQSLKDWHTHHPLRMYIVYGANTFMKTALHLARPLMPFKVKIANNFEHAWRLICRDRSDKSSQEHRFKRSEKRSNVTQADIDKLMALVGRINWEEEGLRNDLEMNEEHPLFYLYQSIMLIKEELDDLFHERKLNEMSMKKLEKDREHLIKELREKIENIKTLEGMLSICSSCKKIRDDQGHWEGIEYYISKHSKAKFSHSICLECAQKLYPEMYG